jgi:hypothetical protein
VYDRQYGDRELTFEASGGLIKSSLVMQDQETDSYWAIMRGESLHGELQGTPLREIAQNRKMIWGEWKARHPDTLVLSVDGKEDSEEVYDAYFMSEEGFRGSLAEDTRLPTKAPIFAFRLAGKPHAVAYATIVGGRSFESGGERLFLYRDPSDGLHDSSRAFIGDLNGCEFDASAEEFRGESCPQPLPGFDTFWYNWSLNNPDTALLE